MGAFDVNRTARRDTLLAAVLLVIGLVMYALPPSYQDSVRNAVRTTALRPFLAGQSRIAVERGRRVDLADVRAQRDSMLAVLSAREGLLEENRHLRALLGLGERAGTGFVPAEVSWVSEPGAESTFFLNVGSEDGVREGSAVIAAAGLLGVVRTVSENRAQGIDWTSAEFRVSAMTDGGSAYGIVAPRTGRFREEDMLVLTGASFHSDIPSGTRLVTSGRGGLYPRGIPIGTVIGIEEADTGWRKSYLVRPTVRPEALAHALVVVPAESDSDLSRVWHVPAPPAGTPADTADESPGTEAGEVTSADGLDE